MTTALRNGIAGLFRRLPPPDAAADAALLSRFVQTRDEAAFGEIVRRHGAMVLGVCRRRLGNGPDADDAYQVAFLALARDARRIAARESLAGWLYRVAHLTALKLAGRAHRRKPEPLMTDPPAPTPTEPDADLKAVLDQELAALPDRFRGVAVLCLVEGLTNTEAADRLGLPKGTVDSRLHAAKAKLRDRLRRRGVAAATVATLDAALRSGTASASARAAALATHLIPLALNYAAGVPLPGSEHLTTIANGVNPTMTVISTKWLAVAALTAGLLGTAAGGVYIAAADKAPPKKNEDRKPDKPEEKPAPPRAEREMARTADDVQRALAAEVSAPAGVLKLDRLIEVLNAEHGLSVRVDTPAFVRRGVDRQTIADVQANKEIQFRGLHKLPLADVLREALGQLSESVADGGAPLRLSYRIKGNQILIVPEYQPAHLPHSGRADDPPNFFVRPADMVEYLYGEPVTVRYKNKSLPEVVEDLQERTGANIVLNMATLIDSPEAVKKVNTPPPKGGGFG